MKQPVPWAKRSISSRQLLNPSSDNFSERMIEDLLHRTKADRTTIVVAHRLSSIRNGDVIMALDQGQRVECETHDRLTEKNGLYHRLVTSQEREQENHDGETKDGVCLTPKWCSSHTSSAMKENEETEDQAFSLPSLFEMLRLNRPELHWIVLGSFTSLVFGANTPVKTSEISFFQFHLSYNSSTRFSSPNSTSYSPQ